MPGTLINIFKFDSEGNLLQIDDLIASGTWPPRPVPPKPPVVHREGTFILEDDGNQFHLMFDDAGQTVSAIYEEIR